MCAIFSLNHLVLGFVFFFFLPKFPPPSNTSDGTSTQEQYFQQAKTSSKTFFPLALSNPQLAVLASSQTSQFAMTFAKKKESVAAAKPPSHEIIIWGAKKKNWAVVYSCKWGLIEVYGCNMSSVPSRSFDTRWLPRPPNMYATGPGAKLESGPFTISIGGPWNPKVWTTAPCSKDRLHHKCMSCCFETTALLEPCNRIPGDDGESENREAWKSRLWEM